MKTLAKDVTTVADLIESLEGISGDTQIIVWDDENWVKLSPLGVTYGPSRPDNTPTVWIRVMGNGGS